MATPGSAYQLNYPIIGAAAMTSGTAITTPGRAIQISVTGAGTVTLTLTNGSTVVVNPVVGDNIYPYSVKMATDGTATGATYTNLN